MNIIQISSERLLLEVLNEMESLNKLNLTVYDKSERMIYFLKGIKTVYSIPLSFVNIVRNGNKLVIASQLCDKHYLVNVYNPRC